MCYNTSHLYMYLLRYKLQSQIFLFICSAYLRILDRTNAELPHRSAVKLPVLRVLYRINFEDNPKLLSQVSINTWWPSLK